MLIAAGRLPRNCAKAHGMASSPVPSTDLSVLTCAAQSAPRGDDAGAGDGARSNGSASSCTVMSRRRALARSVWNARQLSASPIRQSCNP